MNGPLIAWKPRPGAVARIVVAKKDGADATAPPGTWMVLDRAPTSGCWWLRPGNAEAKAWAAEHPDEAKLMQCHGSRLVSSREPVAEVSP